MLLSIGQCILLCFRFRVGVCYDFVFVSSCLLRLMFIVVLCTYVTILLTCLLVFTITTSIIFFFFLLFVDLSTYYDMIGCVIFCSVATCANALLDIIVCVCLFLICIYLMFGWHEI